MEMERLSTRVTQVTLSERNLRSLLVKLDDPWSRRTLTRETDGGVLIVTAEPDAIHYRDRVPGPMSESTERAIGNI